MVSPPTGRRTRNATIALRLHFSEPLSVLRMVSFSENEDMSVHFPVSELVINTSREGTFSIELAGVDLAENVQQRPTVFSWTTDTSKL